MRAYGVRSEDVGQHSCCLLEQPAANSTSNGVSVCAVVLELTLLLPRRTLLLVLGCADLFTGVCFSKGALGALAAQVKLLCQSVGPSQVASVVAGRQGLGWGSGRGFSSSLSMAVRCQAAAAGVAVQKEWEGVVLLKNSSGGVTGPSRLL